MTERLNWTELNIWQSQPGQDLPNSTSIFQVIPDLGIGPVPLDMFLSMLSVTSSSPLYSTNQTMPRLLGKLVTLNIQLYRIHSVHECINVPNFFPLLDPVPFLLTLGLVMRLVWPITHSSKKPFHNWSGLLSLFNKWHKTHHQFSSVQFSHSVVSDSLWPHELQHARPPCPSQTPGVYSNTCPLSRMPFNHLILCRPLLLLPPIPSSIRVFSNESILCMRWPKYWSFSFSISPSIEQPGLICFRMDCLDLLAV